MAVKVEVTETVDPVEVKEVDLVVEKEEAKVEEGMVVVKVEEAY